MHELKKVDGSNNFSGQFIKIISHYKKIGYNIKETKSATMNVFRFFFYFLFKSFVKVE